jgi:signal transduction histidine kinase
MKVKDRTKAQLISELAEARRQIEEMQASHMQMARDAASCQEALARDEAIVKAFHGSMYVCSSTYEIEFVNDRAIQRTGHDPIGEKCYRAIHDLENVCPWCVRDQVSLGQTASQEVISPKDYRWYHTVHTPFHHHGGSVSMMAMLYDVTERKLAEAQRERLIAELKLKNSDLQIFTHAVSHDLKNPLITVRGLVKWIERDAIGGRIDRLKVNLRLIESAVARIEQIVEDLLELSRIGRVCGRLEEVSIRELASEAVQLASGIIVEKGVKVDIAGDLPSVWGDRSRLLQVLQNLIENAVKFMGAREHPKIEIGVRSDDGGTVFYVKDNGIGIDPADQGRIFDLFAKLDEKAKGTGLGLALVKRIVETHGGRIWVESQGREKGASFYFTLGPSNAKS